MSLAILYLDDNDQMLRLFAATFGDEYDVRTAGTAGEAFRMLAERPADVVISDRKMPGLQGTEFLARMKELYPDSFRMLLSGYATVGTTMPEITSGVVEQLILKPWTNVTMRAALGRASVAVHVRGAVR